MTSRNGVDVASFQGPPGQWQALAGDIGWAAVKLTELQPDGNRYVNPDAKADLDWLAANGKKRILYLYAHPSVSAAETASFFIGEARSLGLRDDDGIAVDLEENDGRTPAEVADWAREVLAYLEHDLERIPVLYTYPAFAEAGNCTGLGAWPLWISDPNHTAGHPASVPPWNGAWFIHQYQTTGVIDRDLAVHPSAEAMAAVMGRHTAKAKPAKAAKVKKKTVRKTVKKVTGPVRKTVKAEPVMTAASANAAIAAAVVWLAAHAGLHWTVDQKSAIITIVTALTGAFAAYMAKPRRVTLFFTALSTGAVAAGAFGYHLSPQFIATDLPTLGLIVAGILRGHVTPTVAAKAVEDVTTTL